MRHLVLPAALLLLGVAAAPAHAGQRVQIALVVDASQSMRGFTDRARAELKQFVLGYLPKTREDSLEVAVAVFGFDKGNTVTTIPFSHEAEEVLAKLDELVNDEKLSGGSEGPGRALESVREGLRWNPSADARFVVVVGNEHFDQTHSANSPIGTQEARRYPRHKVRIRVTANQFAEVDCPLELHTIFCGPAPEGERDKWESGADLGGGTYTVIDPSRR